MFATKIALQLFIGQAEKMLRLVRWSGLLGLNTVMDRPFCQSCRRNPAAVNHRRGDAVRYRSQCTACIRQGRDLPAQEPLWRRRGYERRRQCDLCGFRSQYASQIQVVHCDGDLNNCELANLRSVCLNCLEVVRRRRSVWRPGAIVAD
jgi:hypothetical protein